MLSKDENQPRCHKDEQPSTRSCTETTDDTQLVCLCINIPTEGFFQLAITHPVTPMLKMKKV